MLIYYIKGEDDPDPEAYMEPDPEAKLEADPEVCLARGIIIMMGITLT